MLSCETSNSVLRQSLAFILKLVLSPDTYVCSRYPNTYLLALQCDLYFLLLLQQFFSFPALGGFSRGLYVEKWAPFVKVNDDKICLL